MCDIFLQEDLKKHFRGKSVLFLGDSIMRNIYKDFVWLTDDSNNFVKVRHMKAKGEERYLNDNKVHGSALTAGRDYAEERDYYYKTNDLQYTFMFITKCFSENLFWLLKEYPQRFGSYPDLIIINSVSNF